MENSPTVTQLASEIRIPFDSITEWIQAYRNHDEKVVLAAVCKAFRRRFMLSYKEAGVKVGVSPTTWNRWENGDAEMRWHSKKELIKNKLFLPQHFGLDAAAEDLELQTEEETPKAKKAGA